MVVPSQRLVQEPDRLFKRHGRWKSEPAKDDYIKERTLLRAA